MHARANLRGRSDLALRRTSQRPGCRVEPLEGRAMLSAGAEADGAIAQRLLGQGFVQTDWKGDVAYAQPGEWIVRLGGIHGAALKQLQEANALLGRLGQGLQATRHLGEDGVLLMGAPKAMTFEQLSQPLSRLRAFKTLEPNFAVWTQAQTVPNDPRFPELWGLNNTGQLGGAPDADIDAPEAWNALGGGGGGGVVVGVIDTGIDYTHPDLAANIWTNPGEVPGDALDNDGNGYVDDVHGYDFANNDGDPMDDSDHGTHVSGTIAARGDDGVGVAGVAWNAQLVGIKFLNASGSGTTAGAIASVNYATALRTQGVNIRLTSNSWGGAPFSAELQTAIANSGSAGMLFVAAAGNNNQNSDTSPAYPAAYNLPNIISVAATDRNDARAYFSNYGASSVDLGAPGVDVLSTVPYALDVWDDVQDGYSEFSGTSMATPHVSGVAALAFAYKPGATYQEIRDAIFRGANRTSAMSGITVTGGRLNAFNTLSVLDNTQLRVIDSTPAAVAPANIGIKDFVVRFSNAVDSLTFNGSDFSVDTPAGTVSADSFVFSASTPDTVTFRFITSPVATTSTYTMSIPGTAITSQNNVPLTAWSETFVSQEAFTRSSGEVNVALPDQKTIISTLTVNRPDTVVRDVNVRLHITHKFDSDLVVTLISPNGTRVLLFSRVGGNGDNFGTAVADCKLDDEATTLISSAGKAAPFAGSYKPQGALSSVDGQNANGAWKMEVYDAVKGIQGVLKHWALDFILAAAPAPTAATLSTPTAAAAFSSSATATGTTEPDPLLDADSDALDLLLA